MDTRGDLKLVASAVLVLLFMMVVIWIVYPKLFGLGKQLAECDAYCANDCGDIASGYYRAPKGHEWCEAGYYDVSKGRLATAYRRTVDELTAGNPQFTASRALGRDLGLMCCGKMPDAELLPQYLTKADRKAEEGGGTGGRRTGVTRYPRLVMLYGTNAVASGYTIPTNAEQAVTFTIRAENVRTGNSGKYQLVNKVASSNGEEYDEVFCNVALYRSDGKDLLNLPNTDPMSAVTTPFRNLKNEICLNLLPNQGNAIGKTVTLTFPSAFTDQTLELEVLLTRLQGYYDTTTYPADTKATLRFQIVNPLKISGLTAAATREKRVELTCDGVECKFFTAGLMNGAGNCPKLQIHDPQQGGQGSLEFTISSELSPISIQHSAEGAGKATVVLASETDKGYLCAYGITSDRLVYTRKSTTPVWIDRTKPVVDAVFLPADMRTDVRCSDPQSTAAPSGCKAEYGYAYIAGPVDFIGALFTGVRKADVWCPEERNAYRFTSEPSVPFLAHDDFMVLCVYAEDNAGNVGKDIELVYNAWDILAQIAKDQLANGGPGTGYLGAI